MSLADVLAHQARIAKNRGTLDAPPSEGVTDESDLHDRIIAECRRRGYVIVHSRMDRRTTTAVGTTDFVIAADRGRTLWLECKTVKGKLTREQEATIHWLKGLGHVAEVIRSFEAFRAIVDNLRPELNAVNPPMKDPPK